MIKNILGWVLFFLTWTAQAAPIQIVAAENVYGGIAKMIGGDYVQVTSILKNPKQDPHLFSNTPATAKAVSQAQIIIYNGLGYDPWIQGLITTDSKNQKKTIIAVANLTGRTMGDNPHIWYDPSTIGKLAEELTEALSTIDSSHQNYYQNHFDYFKTRMEQLQKTIRQLHQHYSGAKIIATEPVFNEMAKQLSLIVEGKDFQISIMNGSEPSFSQIKTFENNLKNHSVKVLIFNNQVSSPLIDRLLSIAKQSHIPVVGVSETQPDNLDYFDWMNNQLQALGQALSGSKQ